MITLVAAGPRNRPRQATPESNAADHFDQERLVELLNARDDTAAEMHGSDGIVGVDTCTAAGEATNSSRRRGPLPESRCFDTQRF